MIQIKLVFQLFISNFKNPNLEPFPPNIFHSYQPIFSAMAPHQPPPTTVVISFYVVAPLRNREFVYLSR